jgi:hypothetical protein
VKGGYRDLKLTSQIEGIRSAGIDNWIFYTPLLVYRSTVLV